MTIYTSWNTIWPLILQTGFDSDILLWLDCLASLKGLLNDFFHVFFTYMEILTFFTGLGLMLPYTYEEASVLNLIFSISSSSHPNSHLNLLEEAKSHFVFEFNSSFCPHWLLRISDLVEIRQESSGWQKCLAQWSGGLETTIPSIKFIHCKCI